MKPYAKTQWSLPIATHKEDTETVTIGPLLKDVQEPAITTPSDM